MSTSNEDLNKLRKIAQDLYAADSDDDIEVDPLMEHLLSWGEDGVWVRMWGFVNNEILDDAGIDNPEAPRAI